ncbi:hypothetical protein PM8797T_23284 [Gimesia maris DSM 8797]|uniref:J domain-containing protein n=1 Tax=Gimesia maris TaxID=122 RepID=A0ABX5YR78_9PLAN|nr:hypothetical protein PM8797T_23284 [Gimesia maris DSM 8797]QEG18235.1 hypothetical protein GmarT_41210 [Gimesia maris]
MSEMDKAHRPNYYRVLGLDPSVKSWSEIEARINELIHYYCL